MGTLKTDALRVPLLDLKAQYSRIKPELMAAVESVMDGQHFINGPEVSQLEQEIAAYSDCRSAVGVSSGTDALLCSLMALGIGPGDEVITTPYTFFATAGSIWRTGAKPVFVDIDADTFNIDATRIPAAITSKTRAILPVHLFGQMADMGAILELAEQHGLYVIEDAAQAIGASHDGKKAGSLGTTGCFSFFPSKNLGGLGDGGMIVTQDEELAGRVKQFRNHGAKKKYFHECVGGNFRLDTIQAAALLVKLRYLDEWSEQRRQNAARYDELFADVDPVTTPIVRHGNLSIYNQYVIQVPRRDELRDFLASQGIATAVYYPRSQHEQACFASLGHRTGDFPVSERAARDSLALPVYPEIGDERISHVARKVKEFFS